MSPELVLLRQARVADLLGLPVGTRLEASGVVAHDGLLDVIFDNTHQVARLDQTLQPAPGNTMLGPEDGPGDGYEDIALDPDTGRRYLLVESVRQPDDRLLAVVDEVEPDLSRRSRGVLDFPLPSPNKGLEGLTLARTPAGTFLLGMCEGNFCATGAAGQEPGGGRIQVFRRGPRTGGERSWPRVATVELPDWLPFRDYSSLSLHDGILSVLTQRGSALWIGGLDTSSWSVTGPGVTYLLPRRPDGSPIYPTAEGVTWLAPDQVVIATDRAKPGEDAAPEAQQSLHVFRIPA